MSGQLTTICYMCEKTISRVPIPGPLVCDECKAKASKKPPPLQVDVANYWKSPPSQQGKVCTQIKPAQPPNRCITHREQK